MMVMFLYTHPETGHGKQHVRACVIGVSFDLLLGSKNLRPPSAVTQEPSVLNESSICMVHGAGF